MSERLANFKTSYSFNELKINAGTICLEENIMQEPRRHAGLFMLHGWTN